MSHKDTLQLLFPLDLEGDFQADLAVEGQGLDDCRTSAERLLLEMFADTTVDMLSDWERVCGLNPADDEPFQSRQAAVINQLRALGDIKAPYFVALAAALGYTVTIDYDVPAMAGWSYSGDYIYIPDCIYIWLVTVLDQPGYYVARAGASAAGERLLWWPVLTGLEGIFNDLKPAHVFMFFIYP